MEGRISNISWNSFKRFSKFIFYGPGQGPMTANFTHSLDEQSAHVAYILKQLDKKYEIC